MDPFLEMDSTPMQNVSSSSHTVARKRYPSYEEYDSLKTELEKTKMALIKKEAECLEAENAARRSEDLVAKMEFNIR
jgi:hypothetical protein